MTLVQIPNLDAWSQGRFLTRAAMRVIRAWTLAETRRFLRGKSKEEISILGPESLRAPLLGSCRQYALYSEEFAKVPWELALQSARELLDELRRGLEALWASEDERRAWRAVEPWLAHQLSYRVFMPQAILERLSKLPAPVPSGLPATLWQPGRRLFRSLDLRFEARAKRRFWNQPFASAEATEPGLPAGRAILLISSHLYAPRAIAPLAEELTRRGRSFTLLASPNGLFSGLPEDQRASWERANRVRGQALSIQARAGLRLESRWEALRGPLLDLIGLSLQEDWPTARTLDQWMQRRFERVAPEIVVQTKNLRVFEGVVSEWAHARGIPQVFLDSGTVSGNVDHIRFDPSDHVVVASPYTGTIFRQMGAPEAQVHRFGDLRFDSESPTRSVSAASLWPSASRLRVLAVGEAIGEITTEKEIRSYYEALAELGRRQPDVDIRLKLHPRQSLEAYHRQCAAWGLTPLRSVQDADTFDLIREASAVVTHVSLVGVETLFFLKPLLVYVEHLGREKLLALTRANPALHADHSELVRSREELLERVGRIRSDPAFVAGLRQRAERFKNQYFYNGEPTATRRTAELLERLLSTQASSGTIQLSQTTL